MFTTYAHQHAVHAVLVTFENIDDPAGLLEAATVEEGGRCLWFSLPREPHTVEAPVGEWIVMHHHGQVTVHPHHHFREVFAPIFC